MKVKAQEKIKICLNCKETECVKNCKPLREYLKKEKARLAQEKLEKQEMNKKNKTV